MDVNGMTSVCFPTSTNIPSSTASVRGRLIVNLEPVPGSELIEIRPPNDCMALLTTSMPTPRPERVETLSTVENPGRNNKLSISLSASTASAEINPFDIARDLTFSLLIPAPLSEISIMILPERWAAESVTVPSGGFPAATRFSGVSSP